VKQRRPGESWVTGEELWPVASRNIFDIGFRNSAPPLSFLAGALAPRFREEVEAQPGDGRVEDYVRTYDRVH
jgi:hypothetical protein